MKKRGFTLIELLAVIVILAVIAIIATPIVLNVVNNAQKKADLNSAYGLLDAGKLYYTEAMLDEEKETKINHLSNIWNDIVVSGNKPTIGELYVNPEGEIAISVIYRDVCYQKHFEEELQELNIENCGLGFVGNDITPPTVNFSVVGNPFNDQNWAKENFYINIKIEDHESGVSNYQWCITTNDRCNPEKRQEGERGTVLVTSESNQNRVCVVGIDRNKNESDIICSEAYQLDKTPPTFEAMDDITINLKDSLNLESGIKPTDTLSGIVETYTYNPQEVERNKTGLTEITYTTEDMAGNIGTYIRKVTTIADTPSITFHVPDGVLNEFGWAKEDFYINIEPMDYSGHGIKEVKWCLTTNVNCNPLENREITRTIGKNILISNESDQNRICVVVVDETEKESDIICSELYRLDKTPPSLSGVGDISVGRYEILDLEFGVTTSDGLSGVEKNFTYNPTSVDTSIAGSTDVTYSVTDRAGNSQSYIRKIIVEAEAPTVTFSSESGKINSNGWAKEDFLVVFTPVDQSGHGIRDFKWCLTTNSSCDPTSNIAQTTSTGAVTISAESASNRICVIVTDKTGKASSTICSDTYRLDKTAPVAGAFNITGTAGNNDWYRSDVNLSANNGSDSLSGHATTTIDRTSVVGNTSGVTATITTADLAGNTATRTQVIKIDKDAPIVGTFNITGTSGNNGWYRSDVNLSANNGSDAFSGHSTTTIDKTSVVGNTSGITVTITTMDNAGNTATRTQVIKIDKDAPIAGTFNITGTLGSNNWYTSNVTLSANNGSDAFSGHASTSISTSSITSDVTNQIVTITTSDQAGNISTRQQSFSIDKNSPTMNAKSSTASIAVGDNNNILSTYFTYGNVGPSSITSTSCTQGGNSITTTGSLTAGTYTISCTTTKANGKLATASINLTVQAPSNVYYTSVKSDTGYADLYRCNGNGTSCSNIKTLIPLITSSGSAVMRYAAANGTYLYYTSENNGTHLYRCNIDGSNCVDLFWIWAYVDDYGADFSPFVVANNSYLYYTSYSSTYGGELYRCNINGSNCTKLSWIGIYLDTKGGSLNPYLAINDSYLYYTSYSTSYGMELYRCSSNGSNCTKIMNLSSYVNGKVLSVSPYIAVNNDYLYYTMWDNTNYIKVYRCKLDGSSCTKLPVNLGINLNASGQGTISPFMTVNDTNLYYTSWNFSQFIPELYRCDLNGSNCTKVASPGYYGNDRGASLPPFVMTNK